MIRRLNGFMRRHLAPVDFVVAHHDGRDVYTMRVRRWHVLLLALMLGALVRPPALLAMLLAVPMACVLESIYGTLRRCRKAKEAARPPARRPRGRRGPSVERLRKNGSRLHGRGLDF